MPVRKPRGSAQNRPSAVLAIRVTPHAKRDEIVAVLPDQTVKIRLAVPPVEGKANKALIEFLAKILSVPRSKIEIIAGDASRDKLVSILDIDSSEAQARLQKLLRS